MVFQNLCGDHCKTRYTQPSAQNLAMCRYYKVMRLIVRGANKHTNPLVSEQTYPNCINKGGRGEGKGGIETRPTRLDSDTLAQWLF